MNSLLLKKGIRYCTLLFTLLYLGSIHAEELITSLTATEIIGYKQSQTVYIELEVKKTRDLHVAFQTIDGSQTIKRTMKRIKKSGKYHFEVPIKNLQAGSYRIASYLTPRGKNWNERITQADPFTFEVVNEEKYVKKTLYDNEDKVKSVNWPKKIIGKQEAILSIKYEITEPRDLHIKLLDSDNWKEHGALVIPVTEPGNYDLPLSNLTDDFPLGNYAWMIYIAAKEKDENISKKYGKHFTLVNKVIK